jgi:hypothetical protein
MYNWFIIRDGEVLPSVEQIERPEGGYRAVSGEELAAALSFMQQRYGTVPPGAVDSLGKPKPPDADHLAYDLQKFERKGVDIKYFTYEEGRRRLFVPFSQVHYLKCGSTVITEPGSAPFVEMWFREGDVDNGLCHHCALKYSNVSPVSVIWGGKGCSYQCPDCGGQLMS